jgi:hypothetical protein
VAVTVDPVAAYATLDSLVVIAVRIVKGGTEMIHGLWVLAVTLANRQMKDTLLRAEGRQRSIPPVKSPVFSLLCSQHLPFLDL